MRVMVSGGTGFLGSGLVNHLRAGGHDVTVLTRRPRRPEDLRWSPRGEGREWRRAVAAADAVVNLAGEPIAESRWTARHKAAILDSRLQATRALVSAIGEGNGRGVLLSGSGVGVYGTRDDDVALDEAAPHGGDFLANVCRAWEDAALAASPHARVVLLRTGLVLSRTAGALPRLALPFHVCAGGRIGTGRQYMSWIHVADWVAMTMWALTTDAVAGPLNVTAPDPVPNATFASTLARVLHRPAVLPAPAFALRLAFGEMAESTILHGQRVVPGKANALGFAFRYPTLESALRCEYD